jgi:archaellum component FlaG (FlaF/FlaG flagellin family)
LTTVATLLIFNKSIDAANASVRSADAADSTFKQQKRTDSLNRIADSIKDYNDSIKFEITFNLNKKSVDSSIAISKASLEAQINQFAIINEPYLQASIDTIYADTARKTIYLTISFKNIGNHPVRIKQFGITNLIQSKIPTFKENFEKGILIDWSNPGEHFVTKDMPFKEPISLISPLGFPSAFKNRTAYMYIAGEVLYINLITKATKKYQFQIRTSPFVKDLNELFYNSNTP